jgi:hypothetical protein
VGTALNPRYLNSTMLDTMFAFHFAHVRAHNQFQLFSYAPWEEDEMIKVLREQYDWEPSPETTST